MLCKGAADPLIRSSYRRLTLHTHSQVAGDVAAIPWSKHQNSVSYVPTLESVWLVNLSPTVFFYFWNLGSLGDSWGWNDPLTLEPWAKWGAYRVCGKHLKQTQAPVLVCFSNSLQVTRLNHEKHLWVVADAVHTCAIWIHSVGKCKHWISFALFLCREHVENRDYRGCVCVWMRGLTAEAEVFGALRVCVVAVSHLSHRPSSLLTCCST